MLLNPAKEQSLSITKDTEVEVCSLEEGFHGAWYRAILEDSPTTSGRRKLRVRYTTLINDDYSTPLTETVEQSFVRPIPPENSNSDEDFEEGSFVDADLKDGWWEGLVIKKIENERFLVYFDSPPDLIEYKKKELRTHFDWIDSKWIKRENKVLSKSSMFRCGTMVEVNCKIEISETVWVPAIIVKEIETEKKLIVKCCNKSLSFNGEEAKPNITVDLSNVRPIPPSVFVDVYELLDHVEAFNGLGWRKGLVREILSEKRYKVSFLATKDESVFQHSDLRPSKEWENGFWHHGTKRKETVSDGTTLSEFTAICKPKKLKIKLRSSMAAKPINNTSNLAEKTESETKLGEQDSITGTPLARESDKMDDDATPYVNPQVIPLAKESCSPETVDVNATTVKETEPGTQEKTTSSPEKKMKTTVKRKLTAKRSGRKPRKMQKRDLNINETGSKEAQSDDHIHEDNNDNYDQPLAAWLLDKTRANEDITTPFVKRSPMWKEIESMEAFKLVAQMPHFNPLYHTKEEFREGVAMGKMVTFSTLLEKVKNLKLNVTKTELKRLKECFNELEKYGFNVGLPLSRIDTIFGLKEKQASVVKARKEKEKEIKEEVKKKGKVEEDLRDVEMKIIELRDQESDLKTKIAEMELSVLDFDKKIEDVEVEFQKFVEAPW